MAVFTAAARSASWPDESLLDGPVPGRFDSSRAEGLQQRRDLDVARWLGVRRFRRPASQAELAHLAPLAGGRDRHSITTEVTVRRGLRYRAWPQLAARHAANRMEASK